MSSAHVLFIRAVPGFGISRFNAESKTSHAWSFQAHHPSPAAHPESVADNRGASLGERLEVQLEGGEAPEVPGGGP